MTDGRTMNATIRVLLVEDDEDDFLITRELLTEVGGVSCELHWARSYTEGLESLSRRTHDVILLDYRLGDRTGLDFLEMLATQDDSPPAILLTGQADRETDLAAMRAGATDYLSKSGLTAPILERSIRYAVERRRTELARRSAELRYQHLVESVGAIVWRGDAETLQFTFVSREAEHLLGYPLERWTSEPTFWLDHLHPEDRDSALASCKAATARSDPHTLEYRMVAAGGREVWLRDIVRPVEAGGKREIAGVMIDITHAREAEEKLRLRDRALAAVSEAIVITDPHSPGHPIISVNPAFEQITGYAAAEALGRNCRFLQGPESDPSTVAEIRSAIAAGQPITTEILNYRKDGSPYWQRLSISPVRDEAGRLTHFVGVQRDITESRRARDELEASHALLQAIIEGTPDGVFAKDLEGRYLLVNRSGAAALEMTAAEVVGRTDAELVPEDTARTFHLGDQQVIETGEFVTSEETWLVGGALRTHHVTKAPIHGPEGQVVGVVGISRDITQRRQMEEALRETNERFLLVQRATQDVIWDWDVGAGTLQWNDEFSRTFGYPSANTSLEWWRERVHPDDVERVRATSDHALSSESAWSDEYRFRRADESYAVVLERGYIMRDDHGTAVRAIGSLLDITEHRQLRAAVEQREAHYRRLVTRAPQAIYALDAEGRFTEINPAGAELLARPPEEILGRPFGEIIAPADLEFSTNLFSRIKEGTEHTVNSEIQLLRPSGEVRWAHIDAIAIRDNGVFAGVHGIARDVTEERAREGQMRLFAAALQNLNECVNVLDEEGRIIYANEAHCRLLGCDPEAWPTDGILAFAPSAAARADLATILEHVRGGAVWRGRLDLRRADGETLRVESHMERVAQDGRSLVFTISRDVGADLEQEQRLRRAERMASIGTLVSGVAHELNNPLAAIVGFTQLLLMGERPVDERDDLETIRREAERMAEIVSNLRHLSRGTQEEVRVRQRVDLGDVVRHVLRTRSYPLRTQNIEVRAEIDADLPPVMGDRVQIEQVVLNLVVNAEQAMARREDGGLLIVAARPSGAAISLQVTDNGSGIAPEHLERVFDPFFTTKGPGEGTGLGLSLVHSIVEEHGGQIRVDSHVGTGTTFRVELPGAAPVEAVHPGRGGHPQEELPSGMLWVLVIDDEESVRRVITRYLAQRGHRVDEAMEGGSGLSLLDAAADSGRPYDVIVSDLRMPGLNGEQLFARLRDRGDRMEKRLVFLTGDTVGEDVEKIRAESNVPVLTKPVDLRVLAAMVEQFCP